MAKSKKDIKKIVSYVGTALMIVSMVFVAQRLRNTAGGEGGINFEVLTSHWIIAGLLLVAITEGLGIFAAGLNFRALVRNVSGVTLKRILTIKVYTESNVYKYIPGGVMYVAGRNRLAVEVDELAHSKVVLATIIEGICMVIGVVVVATVFAYSHVARLFEYLGIIPIIIFALGLLLLIAIPIIYVLRHRIGGLIKNLTSSMETISWLVVVKRLGFSILLMFLYSVTFLITLVLMGQDIDISLGFAIIGLYLLSWLAGFLTPGAPSGLGIREAVMVMFLTGFVDDTILVAAMVMHRVLTVIGDILAFLTAWTISRISSKSSMPLA